MHAQSTPFNMEMIAIQRRTRRTTLLSGAVHLILILFLAFYQEIVPGPEFLTEITFIEPAGPVPTAPQIARQMARNPITAKPSPEQVQFKRELPRAEVEPRPQSSRITEDKLTERLTALQRSSDSTPANISALDVASLVSAPSAAVPARDPSVSPAELKRGSSPAPSTPLELKRSTRTTSTPVVATVAEHRMETARVEKADVTAQRTLAGATLVGPVADRRLLSHETPKYPEWAKKEAVEASVRLYFVVLSGGGVKENIMVQKTSGYADFDRNATAALLTWRFEALPSGSAGEQWGEITFHYRLSEAERK